MKPSQAETPPPAAPPGGTLDRALALAGFLRAHCPWDAAQTPLSLQPCLLEEAHEAAHAIAAGDPAALCDELGDLLLQVVIHAVMAEEAGEFTLDDVARGVMAKMERRNPHVFGDAVATDVDEVMRLWNAAKAAEKAERAEGAGGASRPS